MKRFFLLVLTITILCSCNMNSKNNSHISNIPIILYQVSESDYINAVLYNLNLSSVELENEGTIFNIKKGTNFNIFQWDENELLLSGDVQIAESNYKDKIEEVKFNPYMWKLKDFTVTDKKDFNYSIAYKELDVDIDLKDFLDFKDKNSCYFINGDILDDKYIRMIFKSSNDTIDCISVVKYNLGSKNIELTNFQLNSLDCVFGPSDTILDNEKLYVSYNNSFGYIDLDKKTFIELSDITDNMNKFISEKSSFQPAQSAIAPIGKVGDYIVVNNPVIYINETDFVRLIGIYKYNEPVCKILIDDKKLKLYGSSILKFLTYNIDIDTSNGMGYTFPVY